MSSQELIEQTNNELIKQNGQFKDVVLFFFKNLRDYPTYKELDTEYFKNPNIQKILQKIQ